MSELWKKLHLRSLKYNVHKGSDMGWLRLWATKIHRYNKGCKCREFWMRWIKLNPPNFKTNENYFAWTVTAHNAVNKKLKKQIISVDDALKLYTN